MRRRAISRLGDLGHAGRRTAQAHRAAAGGLAGALVAGALATGTLMAGAVVVAGGLIALPALAAGARTPAGTVPLQTPDGGEFLSPSGNISCEVDNGYAGLHQVYCQTFSPPESVTLSVHGALKKCTGERCLGNPAVNAPTLAYGSSTGVGPFRCLSATDGVTCTVSGGGFRISRAGITVVPKPHRS